MSTPDPLTLFLVAAPGLEPALIAEAKAHGFGPLKPISGGVECTGDWPDVWRANLMLRSATRVLVRIGEFRAFHLAQLDKRARKFPWGDVLRADQPIRVEVSTNRKSKIYHAGAATQRIERAITETLGAPVSPDAKIALKVRIDDNLCTFSVDSSGESLHKRGHKVALNKAPMRETLAAAFLYQAGYRGEEPVLDPMCGSGTFVIEAAEIARALPPGRTREFAFEHLATFDADAWAKMRVDWAPRDVADGIVFRGSDRDAGAITMATDNAERAGVADLTAFHHAAISDLERPDGPPGLIIVNPPYGERIGNKKALFGLYAAMGAAFRERFAGWRVGIITTDAALARATELPLLPPGPPVPHGGLKVRLFLTKPLP